MKHATFDIETNAINDWSTLSDLETVHCMVVKDSEGIHRYQNHNMSEGLTRLSSSDCLVAHNGIGFDLPALKKLYGFGHPRIIDTVVLARLCHPDLKNEDYRRPNFRRNLIGSHSLEAWGERIGVHKDSHGKTEDWSKYSEEMEEYCVQDVVVNENLFNHFVSEGFSMQACWLEMDFAKAIRQQEHNGFPFDSEAADGLTAVLVSKRAELQDELHKVFPPDVIETKTHWWKNRAGQKFPTKKAMIEVGYKPKDCIKGEVKTKEIPFNPNSRDQIAQRLMANGWKPKEYEGKRPAINEAVLKDINTEQSLKLLDYLLISKRLGQISEGAQAWTKMVKRGRIHSRLNTNGAVSGRTTSSHPNLQQIPAVGSEYGAECRACFTPPPGKVLVGADAAGLELRMLASYLHPIDDGSYTKELLEGDIHTANQLAAGLPDRAAAKRFIYSFLYGGGDSLVGSVVGGTSKDGKRIKEEFLSKMPAMATLTKAVQTKVKNYGFLKGLDGRSLPSRSPHSALNLLLQSAGSICTKQAVVLFTEKMQGKDYQLHAYVHDEVQFSCAPENAKEFGQVFVDCIKRAGEILNVKCPLDGEYKVGKNWAETH